MNKSLNSFINDIKSNFSYDKKSIIIMGNEAADLDSMASAVTYAFFLNNKNPREKIFPLINIPRDDFKLRTEAVFLFKEAGININSLMFSEDIDLEKLQANGNLKLILVDHNKIAENQNQFNENIIEILDHHVDEKHYPDSAITDIRPVGSTATIIAELFLKENKENLKGSLGNLLLGTILLDTVNLDPEAGRVTGADNKAAEAIIEITKLDQKTLFDKLQFEKFNVSSLGTYDLLRKDYKEWQLGPVKCGIGAVLQPIETWVDKDPDIEKECAKYLQERGLDVLFGMNAFTNPDFTRQLLIFIPDEKLRTKTVDFLINSDIGLEKIKNIPEKGICLFYNQKNLGISRKKLQPILKDFFEQ